MKFLHCLMPGIIAIPALITYLAADSASAQTPQNGWTLYQQTNDIKVEYKAEECHDNANGTHYEYLVLRFTNLASTDKNIRWTEKLSYNGASTSDTDQPQKQIVLKGNEVRQGGCENDPGDTMRIFKRFLNYTDKPTLTNFELTNFIITDR
jgi:hypothetical protein